MNNFRFITSGKRVGRSSFNLTKGSAVSMEQAISTISGSIYKLKHLTFEVKSTTGGTEFGEFDGLTVLGRPAAIVAQNSTGVDGFYKVPENSYWSTAMSSNTATQLGLDICGIDASSNIPDGVELVVNIYFDVVQ